VQWEFVRAWLAKAEEDVRAAEAILAAELPFYGTASFHAQQAAEKALKAVLVRHQVEFDRTHNLARLLDLAEPVAPGVGVALAGATELTRFAAAIRYPLTLQEPSREDARGHLALAREVLAWVAAALRDYLDAEPSAT
jgi:HEPN domain-containing protein